MAHPVLVRAYTGQKSTTAQSKAAVKSSLPPVSAYSFADIVRSADGPEFQSAIDGIAEICAKSRLSLAEEHTAHLPPVGEITEATSQRVGPQLRKPGLRRALTSVPEGSSGSSEGSRASKRRHLFGFGKRQQQTFTTSRVIRIGRMGRSISVTGITAIADDVQELDIAGRSTAGALSVPTSVAPQHTAVLSLQRLLGSS